MVRRSSFAKPQDSVGKIPINIYVLAAADGLIGDYQLLHADISGGYLAISPHGKYWYVR